MSNRLLVALSPSLLEDDGLLTLSFFFYGSIYSCILHHWTSNRCVVGRADHQNIVDADLLTDLEWKGLYLDHIVKQNFGLLAIDTNHSKNILRVRR